MTRIFTDFYPFEPVLSVSSVFYQKTMLFFGKVRIDVEQLAELGQKLQSGELDTSFIHHTFCLKDDPSVGLNIWEAEDRDDLDKKLAPHKIYYVEVTDITPVIAPQEAQQVLMQLLA